MFTKTDIPIEIKRSIRIFFINNSASHPSLKVVERDINGQIVYILVKGKKVKKKIGLKIFTIDMKRLHKQWEKENADLIQKYMGDKKVSYFFFSDCRPNWVVKKLYIKLMACDDCILFDWKREAVDFVLKNNHICKGKNNCMVCQAIDIDSFNLLSEICRKCTKKSYLDEICSIPSKKCAYGDCAECPNTIYHKIFSDPTLLSIADDRMCTFKILDQIARSSEGKKTSNIVGRDSKPWVKLKQEFINALNDYKKHSYAHRITFYARRYIQTLPNCPLGVQCVGVDFIENIILNSSITLNSRNVKESQVYNVLFHCRLLLFLSIIYIAFCVI